MSIQLSSFPLAHSDAEQDIDRSSGTTNQLPEQDVDRSSSLPHRKKSSTPVWAFCALGMMTILFLI